MKLLTLPLDEDYRGETMGLRADQAGSIADFARVVAALVAATIALEDGASLDTVAEQLAVAPFEAGRVREIGQNSEAVAFLEGAVAARRAFASMQNIPLRQDGTLGDLTGRRVHYDGAGEQAQTLVTAQDGLLYRADGRALDTEEGCTFIGGAGTEMFVLDASGGLHVASHRIGEYQHSSLVAGADVAMSGEVRATAGRITRLSDRSGHYRPGAEHMLQLLRLLQSRGVALDFDLLLGFGMPRRIPAQDFLAAEQGLLGQVSPPPVPLHALLVQQAMRRPGGWAEIDDILRAAGWRLGPGEGVTDIGTGDRVDADAVMALLQQHDDHVAEGA